VLGIDGWRLLRVLGLEPDVWHRSRATYILLRSLLTSVGPFLVIGDNFLPKRPAIDGRNANLLTLPDC
jgi:hypothetical protein